MARVMPTQVVQTIDELFPNAKSNMRGGLIFGHSPYLVGLLQLLKGVPDELITVSSAEYADLVIAVSMIEETMADWKATKSVGGLAGEMLDVKGSNAVSVIRRVLVECPDEIPPSGATELLFVTDPALRDNIRSDLGAVNRALNNAEWKAATVLAGATIEALLHWRLRQASPADVQAAVSKLVETEALSKPNVNLDYWTLHHFIEVAGKLNLLSPDTCSSARLAQNFRNLIHPGRAARLKQVCNRPTAYSAVGALGHVIEDLTREASGAGAFAPN
jgi:hypothetical protein